MLAVAQEIGVTVIDAYDIAEELGRLYGVRRDLLFRDGAHISPKYAAVIAEIMSVVVAGCLLGQPPLGLQALDVKIVSFLWLPVVPKVQIVELESSATREQFVRFTLGTALELRVPNLDVIGIVLNLPGSRGIIELAGENYVYANLNSQYASDLSKNKAVLDGRDPTLHPRAVQSVGRKYMPSNDSEAESFAFPDFVLGRRNPRERQTARIPRRYDFRRNRSRARTGAAGRQHSTNVVHPGACNIAKSSR